MSSKTKFSPTDLTVLRGTYTGGIRSKKGELKWLCLQSEAGETQIKLPKVLRYGLTLQLQPGTPIEVWAEPKKDTLKARRILLPLADAPTAPKAPIAPSAPPKPVKIQVCRKGSCVKRGAKEVWRSLEQVLADHPAGTHVQLQATGCLKECKKGPNLRILPDHKLCSRVCPAQVPDLVDHHLLSCR